MWFIIFYYKLFFYYLLFIIDSYENLNFLSLKHYFFSDLTIMAMQNEIFIGFLWYQQIMILLNSNIYSRVLIFFTFYILNTLNICIYQYLVSVLF